MLVLLLFHNFAFKELLYHTVLSLCQFPPLIIGETVYQPIITGKFYLFIYLFIFFFFFKKFTFFYLFIYFIYGCVGSSFLCEGPP